MFDLLHTSEGRDNVTRASDAKNAWEQAKFIANKHRCPVVVRDATGCFEDETVHPA